MAPRVHPVSLLVFLVGLAFGIVGITLAIVFGVKNSGSCPKCPDVQPCKAQLFTIRTGVTDVPWDDALKNSSSPEFIDAQKKVSQSLTQALNSGSSSSSVAIFSNAAAAPAQSYDYVVTVTRFMQSQDKNSVVAFASGAATGSDLSNLPHDLEGSVQDTLNNQASTANVTDPSVNYDAMDFCLGVDTNLGVTGTPPTNGDLTTPCDVTTCATLTPECPTTTCPEVNASTCAPYNTCPTIPSTVPTCPTPVCPTASVTTCPPPPACPTPLTSGETCPPPPTCPAPTTCPAPPECPTPLTSGETCPPPPTCPAPTTCPAPPECPTPLTSGETCPTCPPPPTCPAPTTCPAPPECPTPLTSGETCPPPPTCPAPTTCPQPPECPTPLTSGETCPPPPTCPAPTTCSAPPECPTQLTSGETCPPPPTCPAPTTCPAPPECPTPLTSGETCPPPPTCPAPTTCPTCAECPTTPTWTQTPGPTTMSLNPGTAGVTTTLPGSTPSPQTTTTQGSTTSVTGTTTLPSTGTSQGITTPAPGTTASGTTEKQGSTTSFTGTTPTAGSSTQGVSSSETYSSTVMTTTEMESTTTTQPPCYGKQYFYGNLAVLFEHTLEPNQAAQDAQNVMINTFITLQLIKYDGYLIDGVTTRTLPVPYPDPKSYQSLSQSFQNGIRNTAQFNSTLFYVDILPADSANAQIDDGLKFVLGAQAQDRPGAVIIVGISADFVDAAKDSAAALKQKGYSVFTVALNGTGDLSPLASDPSFAFDLKNPKSFDKAEAIATNIGSSILALSPICIGGTPPTTPPPTTTPIITSTLSTTPTTPNCPMKFLSNDIAFVFENSLDAQNSIITSNMSASYLSSYLIPKAMSDLLGSGTWSTVSQFALVDYPDPAYYPTLWGCCDFGKVTQTTYASQLQAMIIAETAFQKTSSSDSLNDGLVYANQQFTKLNDSKKLSIVLFANSADGVVAATATAQSLRDAGNAVVTVAVGGKFDLSPLSTDNTVHYLDSKTNKDSLTTEILAVLKQQGTVCCDATHCF